MPTTITTTTTTITTSPIALSHSLRKGFAHFLKIALVQPAQAWLAIVLVVVAWRGAVVVEALVVVVVVVVVLGVHTSKGRAHNRKISCFQSPGTVHIS